MLFHSKIFGPQVPGLQSRPTSHNEKRHIIFLIIIAFVLAIVFFFFVSLNKNKIPEENYVNTNHTVNGFTDAQIKELEVLARTKSDKVIGFSDKQVKEVKAVSGQKPNKVNGFSDEQIKEIINSY